MKIRFKWKLPHRRANFSKIGARLWRWTRRPLRYSGYALAGALAVFAVSLTAARLLLPQLAASKAEVESVLSEATGFEIRIGRLSAFWQGLNPGLRAERLTVYAANSLQPAMRFSDIRISIALLELLRGELAINELIVSKPSLAVEYLADGQLKVSGLEVGGAPQTDASTDFVAWLLKQRRLEIRDGQVQWFDHREPDRPLHLERVNLALHNAGDRHRLALNADFPAKLCAHCALVAELDGNPIARRKLNGRVYVAARGLRIEALPLIARGHLPEAARAEVTTELWSEWRENRLVALEGSVRARDLHWPAKNGDGQVMRVRELSSAVDYEREESRLRFAADDLRVQLTDTAWSVGQVRLDRRGEASRIYVEHVELAEVTKLLALLSIDNAAAERWRALAPSGELNDVAATVTGPLRDPKDYQLRAAVANLAFGAADAAPGLRGLNARLKLDKTSGEMQLQSEAVVFDLPKVFRAPLPAMAVHGTLAWRKESSHWEIDATRLRLHNQDGEAEGRFSLRVPFERAQSPTLDLRFELHDGRGKNVQRYYPVHRLKPKRRAWMERAFIDGHVLRGHVVFQGPVREFPFNQGQGRFEVRAQVKDGVYSFLPGWMPVTGIEADVHVQGEHALITGRGRLGSLRASHFVVESRVAEDAAPEDPDPPHTVTVTGEVAGEMAETLRVLRAVDGDAENAAWQADIPPSLAARGEGWLGLRIKLNVREPEAAKVRGEYRFLGGELSLDLPGARARALSGQVRFDRRGVTDGNVRAELLGGAARLALDRREEGLRVELTGTVTGQGLGGALGPRFADRIGGAVAWQAGWTQGRGLRDFEARTEPLSGLDLNLPEPLGRGERIAATRVEVTSQRQRNAQLFDIRAGELVNGKLLFREAERRWRLERGHLALGERAAPLPDRAGLHLTLRGETLDLDAWGELLDQRETAATGELIQRLSADFHAVHAFGRNFGKLAVDLHRVQKSYAGRIAGHAANGSLKFDRRGDTPRIQAELSELRLPERSERLAKSKRDPAPERLPIVRLQTDALYVKGRPLGRFEFAAQPVAGGWRFNTVKLTSADMETTIKGTWYGGPGAARSQADINFISGNIGKTLEAFGLADQMGGGVMKVDAKLSWPGAPADFDLARVTGRVSVDSSNGSFPQVKQGAGRFLGVLDLGSVVRYLTLDFRPIFGKGFIYDRIRGDIDLNRGEARTDNLSVKGRSAYINVNGEVGLAAETFNLLLEVTPRLTSGLTFASWWLWGPQAGALALAIQKLFQKPIKEGVRVVYAIKGPWSDPKIERVIEEGKAQPGAGAEKGAGESPQTPQRGAAQGAGAGE